MQNVLYAKVHLLMKLMVIRFHDNLIQLIKLARLHRNNLLKWSSFNIENFKGNYSQISHVFQENFTIIIFQALISSMKRTTCIRR